MFARYPDASAYAEADLAELEGYVRNTGFYRQKAKTIRDVCRELVARFGGEVPRTMEEMVTLPGVARKTANVVPGLAEKLPEDWRTVLAEELNKDYCQRLQEFIAAERAAHTVFPAEHDVFNAFKLTPYERVKVLLLGQDPYHDDGQAHGLCFSVRPGVKPPPSLVNIFKELHRDLGCPIPNNGYLTPWAEQGVMLLNAVLTVRAHEPACSRTSRNWRSSSLNSGACTRFARPRWTCSTPSA